MERRYVLFITLFTVLLPWTAVTASNGPSAGHTGFIANNGQVLDDQGRPDPRTLYYFQGADLDVSLRPDGFAYVIWTRREATVNERTAIPSDRLPEDLQLPPTRTYEAHRIAITFERASSAVQVEADEPRAGYFNYYTAGLPAEGVTRVPHFTTVTYRELYPHIDVVFHLTDRDGRAAVKYDLIVRPGGDLSAIRMRYEGAPAALTPGGLLVLDTPLGPMQERVPESWYQHGQRRSDARVVPVALDANVFGFRYDGSEATPEGATLVIDPMPTLSWEATFDEEDAEVYSTSTFDAAGYVYAAGARSQPLFGGTSTVVQGPSDVLLAKYDGAGQLMWLTYMGGGGAEGAAGIGTLPSGDVVIGGQTDSPQGMATVGAWQAAYGGGYRDGFIARFNTAGLRVWSMYYGGNYFDHITDLACDASGRIVVTGSTESAVHMASPNAVDPIQSGLFDVFVAQFSSAGARQWGTYLGGSGHDYGRGIATDGNAVMVTGSTSSSTGVATAGAFMSVAPAAGPNAFIARYHAATGAKTWCTYYGGSGTDEGSEVVLEDYTSNVYVCGGTDSPSGIASPGAHQPALAGNEDGFLAKFNATGQRFWGTYLGGTGREWAHGLRITAAGRLYVIGRTFGSEQGIASADALFPSATGNSGFLMRYTPDGSRLWGTYLPSLWGKRLDTREISTTVFGVPLRYTLLLIGGFVPDIPIAYTGAAHLACLRESHTNVLGMVTTPSAIAVGPQANGSLRLEPVLDTAEEEGQVVVHDLQGRLVHKTTWPDLRMPLALDIGDGSSGVYIIQVTTLTRAFSTKVLVSP